MGKDFVDIMVICMLLAVFVKKSSDDLTENKFLHVAIILMVVSYSLGLVNTCVFSEMSHLAKIETVKTWKNLLILPALYYITVNGIKDEKWFNPLILCMALSILGMSIQFRNAFAWYDQYHYDDSMRISGALTYLGPNEFGAFFVQYVLVLLGIFWLDKLKTRRIFLAVTILFATYPILHTYSRSAYLSTFMALLFFSLVRARKLLILLLVLLAFWRILLPVSVVERIDSTFVSDDIAIEEASGRAIDIGRTRVDTVGRSELWKMAFEMFSKNPIIGTGFNSFRYSTGWDTHNLYLKVLAEQGLIGFLAHVILFAAVFKKGWLLFRISNHALFKGLGLGFSTCLVATVIGNLTGDHWSYYNLMAFFWVFLGLVARARVIESKQGLQFLAKIVIDKHGGKTSIQA
jgi:O-antigen ligase